MLSEKEEHLLAPYRVIRLLGAVGICEQSRCRDTPAVDKTNLIRPAGKNTEHGNTLVCESDILSTGSNAAAGKPPQQQACEASWLISTESFPATQNAISEPGTMLLVGVGLLLFSVPRIRKGSHDR